jgi:energy-coupling factor transporter ATP-binding protein EcfA2
MNPIWLLPGLVMGLVLALTSGYWQLLGFSALNAATGLLAHRFRKTSVSAEARVSVRSGRLYFGEKRLPRSLLLWSRSEKTAVVEHLNRAGGGDLRERILSLYATSMPSTERLSLPLGINPLNGRAVELDWQTQPHTLIVGPTGSGKSALLSRVLAGLSGHTPADSDGLRVWLFDYKSGETIEENKSALAGFWCAGSHQPKALAEQWQVLFAELDSSPPSRDAKHIVIVEELAVALEDRQTGDALARLAAQGRSIGLRLIITNQTSSGIPRGLLVNLGNRILLAGSDLAERMMLGSGRPTPAGEHIIEIETTSRAGLFAADYLNQGIPFQFLPVWSE